MPLAFMDNSNNCSHKSSTVVSTGQRGKERLRQPFR